MLENIKVFNSLEEESLLRSLGLRFAFEGKGKEKTALSYPKQVHGVNIIQSSGTQGMEQADGIWTDEKSHPIGVQTADCVPVLFANKKRIMAVHAGWKGMTAGIVQNAIQVMQKSSPLHEIYACIGPCIANCHYEVGPDLLQALKSPQLKLNPEQTAYCLTKGLRDRYYLDLPTLGIFALLNMGMTSKQFSVFRSCTFCHPEKWHSFRRDREQMGRNWSWIERSSV